MLDQVAVYQRDKSKEESCSIMAIMNNLRHMAHTCSPARHSWIRWEVNTQLPPTRQTESDPRCRELVMNADERRFGVMLQRSLATSSVQAASVLERVVSSVECQ